MTMAKTIFKFPLQVQDEQRLIMPVGAQILTVQIQKETPCLWALIDLNAKREAVNIGIYGTGNPVPDNIKTYVGTFQLLEGNLVFHVFILEN